MEWEEILRVRQRLYEEIWNVPMQEVASNNCTSPSRLIRICGELDLPTPPSQYWARLANGERVHSVPLPKAKEKPSSYRLSQLEQLLRHLQYSEEAKKLLWRESDPAMKITVDEELTSPHPIVRRAAGTLRKAGKNWRIKKVTGYGRQPARRAQKEDVFRQQACLHIHAVDDAFERALRVADALLKALELRGFRIEVTLPEEEKGLLVYSSSHPQRQVKPSRTGVYILGTFVEFSIEEDHDVVKIPAPSQRSGKKHLAAPYSYNPRPEYEHNLNGVLALKIKTDSHRGSRRTWRDSKRKRVESCLNAFVVGLIRAAEWTRLEQLVRARQEQDRKERARRREEEMKRKELEARLIYDLDSRVQDWRHAKAVRRFVDAVETKAGGKHEALSEDSELGRWLVWARRYAHRLEESALHSVLRRREPTPKRGPTW